MCISCKIPRAARALTLPPERGVRYLDRFSAYGPLVIIVDPLPILTAFVLVCYNPGLGFLNSPK